MNNNSTQIEDPNDRPLLSTARIFSSGDIITLVVCQTCRPFLMSKKNKILITICENCVKRNLTARFLPQKMQYNPYYNNGKTFNGKVVQPADDDIDF